MLAAAVEVSTMRGRNSSPGVSEPALPPVTYDATLSFAHPALVKAFAYWNSRRGERAMPARADIRPQDMRGFLPHVALIEVQPGPGDKRDYFVRLAGTSVEEVLGRRSGRPLTEGLDAALAERWRAQFDVVLASRQPLRATGRVAYDNKSWLEAEILYAPLSEDGATVGMVFIAFAATVPKPR
ncbi:MAG TPA: PAS domain-containing protein [Rhizomicrobium sp.]|jgi:hypothetical protein